MTSISVILPTFERALLLEGVLRDLIAQPHEAIEILVMDDGSTDETEATVKSIPDPRITYWNLGKLGIPGIINEGILRSTAPYIMFLHDHDQIDPKLLVEMASALDRNATASYVFCGYDFFNSTLEIRQERWLLDLPELTQGRAFLLDTLMPRINSPVLALSMIRRSALEGTLLDLASGGCADVELWHRLASTGDVAYVSQVLIQVRGRDQSSQFSRPRAALDLMRSTVSIKQRFIQSVPHQMQGAICRGWRKQIDTGTLYIAWKALEANDMETLDRARDYVDVHGSGFGRLAIRFLRGLPLPASKSFMRAVRSIVRSAKRSTT